MHQQHKQRKESGNQLADNLHGMMSTHYTRMKKEIGIDEYSHSSDSVDEQSEAVFRQLRPTAQYKLTDLLEGRVKEPKKKLFKSRELRNLEKQINDSHQSQKIARVNSSFRINMLTNKPAIVSLERRQQDKMRIIRQIRERSESQETETKVQIFAKQADVTN